MYRLQADKYLNSVGQKVATYKLLSLFCPCITELLEWIESNLKGYESIDVGYWVNDLFHITVIDSRFKDVGVEYAKKMRIGFTVCAKEDVILWNSVGGHCFVRSKKWKRLAHEYFGGNKLDMSYYTIVNPPKQEKVQQNEN